MPKMITPSRRSVLTAGAAITAFNLVPASVLAQSAKKKKSKQQLLPSERLNLGFVGIGGKGAQNIRGCSRHNIYALCDVDAVRGGNSFERYASAKRFDDWKRSG